jgi:hypothetical protein
MEECESIITPECRGRGTCVLLMGEAVMQSLTDYPSHWLERAENADRLAKETNDPDAKRGMQDVAEAYRRLAHRSAEQEETPWTPEIALRVLGGL